MQNDKIEKKKKKPCAAPPCNFDRKNKNKLVRIRTSHRMQVGHAPCHCHSSNFVPKLLPANKPCATSVALPLHQNHAQQTTAKIPTSAIATSFIEGAGIPHSRAIRQTPHRVANCAKNFAFISLWKSCCAKIECYF